MMPLAVEATSPQSPHLSDGGSSYSRPSTTQASTGPGCTSSILELRVNLKLYQPLAVCQCTSKVYRIDASGAINASIDENQWQH
jgi:hypothetical protein